MPGLQNFSTYFSVCSMVPLYVFHFIYRYIWRAHFNDWHSFQMKANAALLTVFSILQIFRTLLILISTRRSIHYATRRHIITVHEVPIRFWNHRIALKFDSRLGSRAAETSLKFQSDRPTLKWYIGALIFLGFKVWWLDVLTLNE